MCLPFSEAPENQANVRCWHFFTAPGHVPQLTSTLALFVENKEECLIGRPKTRPTSLQVEHGTHEINGRLEVRILTHSCE